MKGRLRKIFIVLLTVFAFASVFGAVACSEPESKVAVTLVSETLEKQVFYAEEGDALPVIQIRDRDFEGYWTDSEYQTKYDGTVVPSEPITLYYKQNLQYYTVRVDYGSVVEQFSFRRGVYERIPLLAAHGNEPIGYSKTENGTMDILAEDTIYNLAEKNQTITLYARSERKDAGDYVIEGNTIVAYVGKNTDLILPYGATSVAAGAFEKCAVADKILSVTVPNTYKKIQCGAFKGLTALEKLSVPFIGESRISNRFLAFAFGAKTYTENDYSFAGYTDGKSLYIGDEHFESQVLPLTLKTVVVTDVVTEFSEGAFRSAYALQNVYLFYPEQLKKVGKFAFENCMSFGYDSSLKLPYVPQWLQYVEEIGDGAFRSYTGNTQSSIKVIYPYGENNPDYTAELLTYSYPFNNLVRIPKLENVVSIGSEAFYYAAALDSLEFGQKLKTIGSYAFAYTISVPSLVFPDSLESIGDFAFAVNGAMSVEFGTGIRKIGAMAFEECSNLSQVVFNGIAVPELSGGQCFSNSLTQNPSGGFEIQFSEFNVYVPAVALNDYTEAADWKEYLPYIRNFATALPSAYWSKDGSSVDAKFDFTTGSIVYVTDPERTFISEYDYANFGEMTYGLTCGTHYPMLYEIIDADVYAKTAIGKNVGSHAKPLYENQVLVRLWHPEFLDFDGDVKTDFYFLITKLPYGTTAERVLMPMMEKTNWFGMDLGNTKEENSFVIGLNEYGVPRLGKVKKNGAFFEVEEVPDPAGTYYSRYTEGNISYTFTYYDKNFKIIAEKEYVVLEDSYGSKFSPIYEKTGEYIAFSTDQRYNNSNSLILNGRGGAKVKIGGNIVYDCSVVQDTQKKFGEEGYTVELKNFSSGGTKYPAMTGSAVFRDFVGGDYARITLTAGDFVYDLINVKPDVGWYRYNYKLLDPLYTEIFIPQYSADLNNDLWRYKRLSNIGDEDTVLGGITIYYLSFDGGETIEKAYYRDTDESDKVTGFGCVQYGEDGNFTLIDDKNGTERKAELQDKRGSFMVDGTKKYVRYDDSEDMTLVFTEEYYGTTLYYYTVKTDGYGNMFILDEHEDGVCDMYLGTYDDFNSFSVNGSNYYELIFTGNKISQNGTVDSSQVVNMWVLYDFGTLAAWSESLDDAQWYGRIEAFYTERDDHKIVVEDDLGFKVYEITVDVYGNASYVQFAHTLNHKGDVTYTQLEKGNVGSFVSVMTVDGDVSYCIALDQNGYAMFTVRRAPDKTKNFVIEYEGGLSIETLQKVSFTVDIEKLEKLSGEGESFGTI